MKREDLKKGYRIATLKDSKDGLIYFVVRDGHVDVSRRQLQGDNDSDFKKWVESDEAQVYVQRPATSTVTTTTKKPSNSTTTSTTKPSNSTTTTTTEK